MSTNESNLQIDINLKVGNTKVSTYSVISRSRKIKIKNTKSEVGTENSQKTNNTLSNGELEKKALKINRIYPYSVSKPKRKILSEIEDSLPDQETTITKKVGTTASSFISRDTKITRSIENIRRRVEEISKTDIIYKKPPRSLIGETQRSMSPYVEDLDPPGSGPGQIEVKSAQHKIPPKSSAVKISNQLRFKNIQVTPGPGDYNNDAIIIKSKAPKFTLSKQPRKELWGTAIKRTNPEYYDVKSTSRNERKVKFLCKF